MIDIRTARLAGMRMASAIRESLDREAFARRILLIESPPEASASLGGRRRRRSRVANPRFRVRAPAMGAVRRAFELYAAKAPVNHPGPQSIARRARAVFWHLLTPSERSWLSTEQSHNVGPCKNEDRRGFDDEIQVVRRRLFGPDARPVTKRPRKKVMG